MRFCLRDAKWSVEGAHGKPGSLQPINRGRRVGVLAPSLPEVVLPLSWNLRFVKATCPGRNRSGMSRTDLLASCKGIIRGFQAAWTF